MSETRPLVLLDVDGVINDLKALHASVRTQKDPEDYTVFRAFRYMIFMPDYMPDLIKHLA